MKSQNSKRLTTFKAKVCLVYLIKISFIIKSYFKLGIGTKTKILEAPEDKSVSEGTNVRFACRSNNIYDQITWLKDGTKLPESVRFQVRTNGELSIQNVRVEDEGFYICSVGSGAQAEFVQAQLVVNGEAFLVFGVLKLRQVKEIVLKCQRLFCVDQTIKKLPKETPLSFSVQWQENRRH